MYFPKKELEMLEVTDLALQKIKDFLAQNNIESSVRIALMQSCGGVSLGLALNDKQDNDEV